MKNLKFTSMTLSLTFTILAFVAMLSNINAQCLEKLPLKLTDACSYTMTTADLVPVGGTAPTSFTVKKPGSAASSAVTTWTFTKNDIGTEFEVMSNYAGGGMCYTYVTILDSNKPVISAALSTTIWCLDLVNGKVPAPGTVAPVSGVKMRQSDEATNVLGTRDATFDVNDCSSYTQFYDDVYGPVTACPTGAPYVYQTVTRTWIFKDKWGNTSDPLVETITIISAPFMIGSTVLDAGSTNMFNPTVLTPTTIYDCTSSATTLPFIDWNLNSTYNAPSEDVVFGKDYCGRIITLMDAQEMALCGGKMITRIYKVNNCGVFMYYSHVTTILDRTSPNVSFEYTDYLRVPEEICRDTMNGAMRIYRNLYKTVQENATPTITGINSGASPPAVPALAGAIKVSPLMNVGGGCNTASISLKVKGIDIACTSGKVTFYAETNSPLRFDNMPFTEVNGGAEVIVTGTYFSPGVPSLDAVDYIYVRDACGNVTKIKVTILIIDNLTPDAACSPKKVSLTNTKSAVVTPAVFSSYKYDNCTSESKLVQYIRKKGTACWQDQLIVNCGDNYDVDIITIDSCLNYNICTTSLTTEDAILSTCLSPNDRTVNCNADALADVNTLFGTPTVFYNCTAPSVVVTNSSVPVQCGSGSYTRTWTYTQTNASTPRTFTCSQKITVLPVLGYRVLPLDDIDMTCGSYVYTEASEKALALARVKFLNAAGDPTCSPAPVVRLDTFVYSSGPYCKIIRLRYTFLDACQPFCDFPIDAVYYKHFGEQSNSTSGTYYGAAKSDGYFQAASFTCTNGSVNIFGYERFIRINDITPPTSTPPANIIVSFPDNRCNFDFPSITLTGFDNCGTSNSNSNLSITWRVINPLGNTIATNTVTTGANGSITISSPDLNNLSEGTYTVRYFVQDFCGNRSIPDYSFTVTGRDDKEPSISAINKNLTLGVNASTGQGMGIITVTDVEASATDNCTSPANLAARFKLQRASEPNTGYPTTATTDLMFTCADKGLIIPIRVWTKDDAGKEKFVIVNITVSNSSCTNTPLSTITGVLKTETNLPLKDVTVSSLVNGSLTGTSATDAAGGFNLKTPVGQNVQLKANKSSTEDKFVGVTTFDIARISRHILDIENFTSPYSMIAADVNKDGEIDATDMVQIRNLILRKSPSLPAGVWRFLDKSYKFKNPLNPFGEDFPEVVNLTNIPEAVQANFIALKVGDVNATFSTALAGVQVRNNNALVLKVEDIQLMAGNEYTIDITSDNFNAAAFQGTFSLNGATIKTVKAGNLTNYNDNNFGLFGNAITTSWNGVSELNTNVMSINFVSNKTAKLSEVLTVGSSLTPAIANDLQGNEMNINIKFTTGKIVGGEFALYQNTPNPMATETTIGFNLPKDEEAVLTIYTIDGKTVFRKQLAGKSGLNQLSINKTELKANGVLYYRLETTEHTATKKMLILD